MIKHENIKVQISGGYNPTNTLTIEMPPDSNTEDWKRAFVTILTHLEFHNSSIKELFSEEDSEMFELPEY